MICSIIICSVCKEEVSLLNWTQHKLEHAKNADDEKSCGPGTPSHRLKVLIEELAKRFPDAYDAFSSRAPEPRLLAAIDRLIKSAIWCGDDRRR